MPKKAISVNISPFRIQDLVVALILYFSSIATLTNLFLVRTDKEENQYRLTRKSNWVFVILNLIGTWWFLVGHRPFSVYKVGFIIHIALLIYLLLCMGSLEKEKKNKDKWVEISQSLFLPLLLSSSFIILYTLDISLYSLEKLDEAWK